MITTRGRLALSAGAGARWASRVTGRGAGAMIGGLVALALDKSVLRQLGEGRRTVVITGTNGKSTTTRMTAAALGTVGPVATNAEGERGDADDAGLPGAEAGRLDVDDRPARAGVVCRTAPGLAHVSRMARGPDIAGSLSSVSAT